MALKTCKVSCFDLKEVKHTVEVSAGSDYEAVAVARRVLQAFARPFEAGSGTVNLSASVGLATAHDETKLAERLIREADIAIALRDRPAFRKLPKERVAGRP